MILNAHRTAHGLRMYNNRKKNFEDKFQFKEYIVPFINKNIVIISSFLDLIAI